MACAAPIKRYRFGAFELQLDERRLLSDGAALLLRPRAFDLLAAFVERAGHLITKDELLERVWPKMVVEEAALHVQVSALRKVLGADAIATVSGQGYRFILPVTKVEQRAKHNLPSQLTSFIGREQEIAHLKDLLTITRLVTLTGAGGAGKTRLAIEVAGALLEAFRDGVWLVELASLSEPALVPQAVGSVLGLKEQPGKPLLDTIGEYLLSKHVLLIVDNVEHLLEPCVRLVDAISHGGARTTVLVTSRERLGVTGELTYRVPSLTVPAPSERATPDALLAYESVRLFVERARLLRPGFSLTSENAPAVASICYHLDGIPLAIELAAPRIRSMSVAEISQRLDHRFALLTNGSRAALPRHRTLRSMIDWSYDLLSDIEQAMLRRLSVFAGGWTLASAEEACTGDGVEMVDVLDVVASLADKSLIVIDEQEGATRYRMLETVRQYALDRLREHDEESKWRGHHLAHFLALAETSFEPGLGPDQRAWLARLAGEHDNFRAALAWSAKCGADEGLRLAGNLMTLWRVRGHLTEGREWFGRVLDAIPDDRARRERARVLNSAGILAVFQGDYAVAKDLYEQSLSISREIKQSKGTAYALSSLGHLALVQDDYAEAERRCGECVVLARELGDGRLLAPHLCNLGIVTHARGDWPAALALFEESVSVARSLGDRRELAEDLLQFGRAEAKEGHHDTGRALFAESITLGRELGDRQAVAEAIEEFASIALASDSAARAVRLLAAGDALRQEIAAHRSVRDQRHYQHDVDSARLLLGADAFEHAWLEGRAMNLDESVRYALADDA